MIKYICENCGNTIEEFGWKIYKFYPSEWVGKQNFHGIFCNEKCFVENVNIRYKERSK